MYSGRSLTQTVTMQTRLKHPKSPPIPNTAKLVIFSGHAPLQLAAVLGTFFQEEEDF